MMSPRVPITSAILAWEVATGRMTQDQARKIVDILGNKTMPHSLDDIIADFSRALERTGTEND